MLMIPLRFFWFKISLFSGFDVISILDGLYRLLTGYKNNRLEIETARPN